MSLVKIDWKPGAKALRKFGLTVLVGFMLIGLLMQFAFDRPEAARVCFIIGAVFGLAGLTGSRTALPFYWLWMGIAFVIGNIMSRVLLAVFYYGVITPTGLLRRLMGKDPLTLRRKSCRSYWQDCPPAPQKSDYERQF